MTYVSDIGKYLNVTSPLDGAQRKFIAQDVFGQERISDLFFYRLTLATSDDQIVFSAIMGKPLTVVIYRQDGTSLRHIHGIVSCFQQADSDGRLTLYNAEIRPWLWQLTLTRDSKIFQNKTAMEIIKAVFGAFGFTDFEDKTTATYAAREYCVQYQETAFDFISRLMEEEGVFYWFAHSADKHTLVLADAGSSHVSCPAGGDARYAAVEPAIKSDDLVEALRIESNLVSNKYAVEDYHFETPETDLLTSVDARVTGNLRVYEYPGRYTQTADGTAIATRRMEALEVEGKMIRGESCCRAFTAGYKFTLAEHNRTDANGEYVLSGLSIEANQESYRNRFDAFPADVAFRPPQRTGRPRITGTQTALVVGKSGEEIWPDPYGRVKVQFHWDQEGQKDENSSCWIRVAQIWAGKGWGTLFTPRIGAEVIVSFLDGDPDRPIIIGTVYNATQTVPYTLPDAKDKSTILTRSSKQGSAGNEIRFTDTKDSEELYVHAQKDYTIKVENDRKLDVLGKETTTITKDRSATVSEGNESLTVTKGNRTVTVTDGTETHSVKKTRALTVTGAETHTSEDNFTHNVTKNYVLKIDGDLTVTVAGKITIKATKDISIKTDANFAGEAGKALTQKAGQALTNEAGTALTNKAGTSLTNKAGTSLTDEAGTTLTAKGLSVEVKASASGKVDGGGMLELKGGMVKIG